ncbi:MAG: hypothetical protein NTY64_14350, partial [Deltaproteobacteria bacterium]|nr:hypothetical protein [Deltaproteobacteria bacterium]
SSHIQIPTLMNASLSINNYYGVPGIRTRIFGISFPPGFPKGAPGRRRNRGSPERVGVGFRASGEISIAFRFFW